MGISWGSLACGVVLGAGGIFLSNHLSEAPQAPLAPEIKASESSTPAPAVVPKNDLSSQKEMVVSQTTPALPPTSLPPASSGLPPLPSLDGVGAAPQLLASEIPQPLETTIAPVVRPTPARHGQRIISEARKITGVRSLAWGDGAQLYVLVNGQNASASRVASSICGRFADMEPRLVVFAQETSTRNGRFISVERDCVKQNA